MRAQHTRYAEFSRERGLKLAQLGGKTAELAILLIINTVGNAYIGRPAR